MTNADVASTDLQAQIMADSPDPTAIAALLDGLSHDARVVTVRSLGAHEQRTLFSVVEGTGRVTLNDLVPPATPDLTPIRHYGMNSLLAFREFEKRFYRYDGGKVGGANFQTISPLTGPGYFVVRDDEARGEALVDYNLVPEIAPEGWPRIVANHRGVSRLIYGFMIDTLRRVSEHVTIGSAARRGKPMGAYFILCRQAAT
jgi:hypothetical protein